MSSIYLGAGPGGAFTQEQLDAQIAATQAQAATNTDTYPAMTQQQITDGVANMPISNADTSSDAAIQSTVSSDPFGQLSQYASVSSDPFGQLSQYASVSSDPFGQLSQYASPTPQVAAASASTPPSDLRVRLAALSPNDVYGANGPNGTGILGILAETGGLIFPYSPQISFSQAVTYSDLQLVHSDTDYNAYTRTPSVSLSVAGKFTVQNAREGQYAMAAIHFFRTVSKSYFGETDAAAGKAGLPPPVLLFSGYGPYMYQSVRVILKSHSWAYDEAMDTVTVNITTRANPAGKLVRLPAMFTIQCELMVIQTPQRMRTKFSFDAFAKGDLLSDGWI